MSENFYIYTDGSFHEGKSLFAGWAWVAVQKEKLFTCRSGTTKYPAKSRNIDGEVYGVLKACYWLQKNYPNATANFFVDYIGIIHWANKQWVAKKDISIKFVDEIQPHLSKIQWTKVLAHSKNIKDPHVYWNNIVDNLANNALKKKYSFC